MKAERASSQLELPFRLRPGEVVADAHASLGGKLVSYRIRRSLRRRTISLVVDEDGLRVGAPWRSTQRAIDTALQRHSAWVLAKLAQWQERRVPPRRWAHGESLMLQGRLLRLAISSEPGAPRLAGEDLMLGLPDPHPVEVARHVLDWMRSEALTCFRERVDHFRMLLALEPPVVKLSNARTRWGSCHVGGRIHLNWRLIQMPMRLIDYVVAHEIAHLKEMNHSRQFWRVVGQLVPDYAALRREIRSDAHRYLLV
jgi:predicted metal-dependent hydrolase